MAEINPEKYKSNSYKAKAESERETKAPVVKGSAKKHTKSFWDKCKETWFGTEIDNVKDTIIFDVAVPTLKDLMVNAITSSIQMLFYGEARPIGKSSKGSYISYDSYSRRRERDRDIERHRRSTIDFSGLDFDTRADAEDVLEYCRMDIDDDGYVSVGRMYEYAKIPPSPTDYNYGWTNLNMVEIYCRSDGQYIYRYLPRPRPIRG